MTDIEQVEANIQGFFTAQCEYQRHFFDVDIRNEKRKVAIVKYLFVGPMIASLMLVVSTGQKFTHEQIGYVVCALITVALIAGFKALKLNDRSQYRSIALQNYCNAEVLACTGVQVRSRSACNSTTAEFRMFGYDISFEPDMKQFTAYVTSNMQITSDLLSLLNQLTERSKAGFRQISDYQEAVRKYQSNLTW